MNVSRLLLKQLINTGEQSHGAAALCSSMNKHIHLHSKF